MNHTAFISDLHLDPRYPERTTHFIRLLTTEKLDALYILGDCFDLWLGDDDPEAWIQELIVHLKHRVQSGCPIYFMRGNHDFLVDKQFFSATGITSIPDPYCAVVYGVPLVLTHGDSLCTRDRAHQRYRTVYTRAWVRWILNALPLRLRQKLAQKIRLRQQHKKPVPAHLLWVSDADALQLLRTHAAQHVVHGHTHQAGVHALNHTHVQHLRWVLGSWDRKGEYLCMNAKGHAFLQSACTLNRD